jgi:hypothetical protein
MPSALFDQEFWPSLDYSILCSCAEPNNSEQEAEPWPLLQDIKILLKLCEDHEQKAEENNAELHKAEVSNKQNSKYLCNFICLEQNF